MHALFCACIHFKLNSEKYDETLYKHFLNNLRSLIAIEKDE